MNNKFQQTYLHQRNILIGAECKIKHELLTVDKKPETEPEFKKTEAKLMPKEEEVIPVSPFPTAPLSVRQRENSVLNNNTQAPEASEDRYYHVELSSTNFHGLPYSNPHSAYPPRWTHQSFFNSTYLNHQQQLLDEEATERISIIEAEGKDQLNFDFLHLQLDGSSYSAGSSRCSSLDNRDKMEKDSASSLLQLPVSSFLSQEINLEHHEASYPDPAPKCNPAPKILNDEMSLFHFSSNGDAILNSEVAPPELTSYAGSFYTPRHNVNNKNDPYCAWKSMFDHQPQLGTPYPAVGLPYSNFSYPSSNSYPTAYEEEVTFSFCGPYFSFRLFRPKLVPFKVNNCCSSYQVGNRV